MSKLLLDSVFPSFFTRPCQTNHNGSSIDLRVVQGIDSFLGLLNTWHINESKAKPVFVELFDHETDPTETINIAKDHPDIVKALSTELDAVVGNK
jgi:hypothetical protein